MANEKEVEKHDYRILLYGVAASAAILLLVLILQSQDAKVLNVPAHWMWVVLAPVTISLIVGGYITKFAVTPAGGLTFDFRAKVPKAVEKVAEITPQKAVEGPAAAPWQDDRRNEYDRTNHLFLVHVYKPSEERGQEYEAFVYLVRHKSGSIEPERMGLKDIAKVDFFFGPAWGNQVFTVMNNGANVLGVKAHAYGTFLATCRVTFADPAKAPITLHRYLDCEMLMDKEAA